MSEDVFEAVVNQRALRDLRSRASISVTTTQTTPVDVSDESAATDEPDALDVDVVAHMRAVAQARAAYAVAEAARVAERVRVPAGITISGVTALARIMGPDGRQITVTPLTPARVTAMELVDVVSRVRRYADLTRVETGESFVAGPFGILAAAHFNAHEMTAFAIQTAQLITGWYRSGVAFNRVEPLDRYETRARELFAKLQNGAALGADSVNRLRDLQEAATDDGEPFSLDALEALVVFANAHPDLATPEFTLSPTGGIIAEWRAARHSVTLYFVTLIHVQYLVKRINPLHPDLLERSSGATSVDRVVDRVRRMLPKGAWPIRG